MDLQALKWTKNVRRNDGTWAYRKYKVSDPFQLEWKDDEVNANKPEKGSLILLRQQGYVTHLVKVLDCKAKRMFDYRVRYQGGNVMELEKLPTFRQRWDDDGGLGGFQTYIRNLLGLSSND